MEYKIIAQIAEVSDTTLKMYVADFFPSYRESSLKPTQKHGNLNGFTFPHTYIYSYTHNITHRMLQSVLEITSLNPQTCQNSQELQY
jgi:hypothetical protein